MLSSIILAFVLSVVGPFDIPFKSCTPRVLDEETIYQTIEIRPFSNIDNPCELANVVAPIVGVVMTSLNYEALVQERPQIVEELAEAEAILLRVLIETGLDQYQAVISQIPLPGVKTWNMQSLHWRLYPLLGVLMRVHPEQFCGAIYYIIPEKTSKLISSKTFGFSSYDVREKLIYGLGSWRIVTPEDVKLLCGEPLL